MARHSLKGPSQPKPWGNRIVGHGTEKAGQFLANPQNWRTHGPAQEGQLTGLLHDVGFVQGVIVNKRTSAKWGHDRLVETLVDGHLRVKSALARGEDTEVPVTYVDLTPEEEQRVLLQFDPIGAMAGRDDELLQSLATTVTEAWPEADIDLDTILRREKRHSQGLAHDVKECTCCQKGCSPGCGCYREPTT